MPIAPDSVFVGVGGGESFEFQDPSRSLRFDGKCKAKSQKDVRVLLFLALVDIPGPRIVLFTSRYVIVRLLASHPNFGITLMTADRKADVVAINDADFSEVDAGFCCLQHGTTT